MSPRGTLSAEHVFLHLLKCVSLAVVHIEGSLGQVAVSTCYSPRRAISAVNAVQTQGPLEVTVFMRTICPILNVFICCS